MTVTAERQQDGHIAASRDNCGAGRAAQLPSGTSVRVDRPRRPTASTLEGGARMHGTGPCTSDDGHAIGDRDGHRWQRTGGLRTDTSTNQSGNFNTPVRSAADQPAGERLGCSNFDGSGR